MLVTCTHCDTTYNLPDDKAVAGTKLRCSVCKNVFRLGEEEQTQEEKSISLDSFDSNGYDDNAFSNEEQVHTEPKKSKKKTLLFLIVAILLISGGSFALWKYTDILEPVKDIARTYLSFGEEENSEMPIEEATATDKVRLIELRNVRQYNISNDKIGKIAVVEGKVVNGFDSPRELIRIEGTLFDVQGKALLTKSLLAGTSASLFQLQVLGEEELEQALSNSIDVIANNSNIEPNGVVPFMILFYNPPAEATEFGVRVIDAREVENTEVVEEAEVVEE